MQRRQTIIGGLTWLGLLAGAAFAVQNQFAAKPEGVSEVVFGIGRWVTGAPEEHMAVSAVKVYLAPGDPVFLKTADGSYRQVGRVRNHFSPALERADSSVLERMAEFATQKASVVLYDDAIRRAYPNGFRLEYHTTPTALDWVVRTMVTPERQQQIALLIAKDWEKHQEEIMVQLQPVVEESIARTIQAIDAELPTVLSAHQGDFAKLADRYQADVIRRQVVPLVRKEILPIVEEEVRPLATSLGKELWGRVSLWSFTWRYLYDVTPLPEKHAVQSEFNRFMKDEVTPALESRSDEFVNVTERILRRISMNEAVRSAVRESLRKVATDGDLQSIVWDVVQEAVINNQTLRDSLKEYWTSAEVKKVMGVASSSFEPTARAVGDAIFGSRDAGITPEFSRVLRVQILMKDRRWLLVVPLPSEPTVLPQPPPGGLVIVPATTPMDYPIEFAGTEQSPLSLLQDPQSELQPEFQRPSQPQPAPALQ